jgi:flagellar hook assembly protein FlgD
MRSHFLTPGTGFEERVEEIQGTGGSAASVALVDRATTGGGVAFDGVFDGTVDWATIAVEIRAAGAVTKSVETGENDTEMTWGLPLERVFPNPVRNSASMAYELSAPTAVEFSVYNVRGQRVRTLHSGSQSPGRHLLHWDTRDQVGMPVPAGIYFVRVQLGERMLKQKIVVQR